MEGKSVFNTAPVKLKYLCEVETCKARPMRGDKLKDHYLAHVKFNENGLPLDDTSKNFHSLSEQQKLHTSFFRRKGYSLQKMPKYKTPVSALKHPWAAKGMKDDGIVFIKKHLNLINKLKLSKENLQPRGLGQKTAIVS